MERIHQVLQNLVRTFNISETYVDEYDLCMGILATAVLENFSTTNSLKGYSPVHFLLVREMILPIKYKVDWELIRQRKQTQINKYNIRKIDKIFNHNYKVGYKVTLNNNAA